MTDSFKKFLKKSDRSKFTWEQGAIELLSGKFQWKLSDLVLGKVIAEDVATTGLVTNPGSQFKLESNLKKEVGKRNLSPQHEKAIETYTGTGHHNINAGLRSTKGDPSGISNKKLAAHVPHLDSITSQPTGHSFHVYRGASKEVLRHLKTGSSFTDHGYTSTSLDPDIGRDFAHHERDENGDGHHHILKIHVPAGTKGHYVAPHSNSSYENEFLIHRGTTYQVHHIEHSSHQEPFDDKKHHTHTYHLTIHGQQ